MSRLRHFWKPHQSFRRMGGCLVLDIRMPARQWA